MKVKELIEVLQKEDPEAVVCVYGDSKEHFVVPLDVVWPAGRYLAYDAGGGDFVSQLDVDLSKQDPEEYSFTEEMENTWSHGIPAVTLHPLK